MDGVKLSSLRQISHPKGDILHALRKSDNDFLQFGEAYFSEIKTGKIKGWKKHTKMLMNLIVPVGEVKFVIYCDKKDNYLEVILSRKNFQRLTISPNLWVAFQGLGKRQNILLNIASIIHEPSEAINCDLETFSYRWS